MNDKMREEFEAWYWGLYGACHALSINEVFSVDSFGVYALMMPRVAYEAWKASREALCVELPKQWFDDGLGCDLMEVNHVADALDAAGVRYK